MKNATVRKYVDLGKTGESPEKIGRPSIIPDAVLEARNLHVTRMQTSSDIDEADKVIMSTIYAMVQRTIFEGSFTIDCCWSRFWHYYPETLVPAAMFDHEDLRSEWLTLNHNTQNRSSLISGLSRTSHVHLQESKARCVLL